MRTIVGYPNIPSGYPAYVPGISFCCEGKIKTADWNWKWKLKIELKLKIENEIEIEN